MTASGQLQMFEPEGRALIDLVSKYLRQHDHCFKKGENLSFCGFNHAAKPEFDVAIEAFKNAQICETAYHLEQLAGLV